VSNFLLFNSKARRILAAGKESGLEINFHGEELSQLGSAEVRSRLQCPSNKLLHQKV